MYIMTIIICTYVLYDTYVCINTSVHTKVDYVITVY